MALGTGADIYITCSGPAEDAPEDFVQMLSQSLLDIETAEKEGVVVRQKGDYKEAVKGLTTHSASYYAGSGNSSG